MIKQLKKFFTEFKKQEQKEIKEKQRIETYINKLEKSTKINIYPTFTCHFCKIELYKKWKKGQTSINIDSIYDTTDSIEFVEHLVKKHNIDLEIAKIYSSLEYINNYMLIIDLDEDFNKILESQK